MDCLWGIAYKKQCLKNNALGRFKTMLKGIRKVIMTVLLTLAAMYVFLLAVLFFMQTRMVFRPSHVMAFDPSDAGLGFENLWLTASDGVRFNAWYVPAPEDSSDPPVVLFCHGNGGDMSHRVSTLELIHEMGMACLLFDYRGYGLSQGKPGEKGIYRDAQAAWDHLVQDKGVAPERIILWGRSLGGGVASYLAKEHQAACLILESTFTSVPDMAARLYPFLPVRLFCRHKFDTASRLDAITCPVMVIHSPQDDMVPYGNGELLFERARYPKHFLAISGNHNEGFMQSSAAYTAGIRDFLVSHGITP